MKICVVSWVKNEGPPVLERIAHPQALGVTNIAHQPTQSPAPPLLRDNPPIAPPLHFFTNTRWGLGAAAPNVRYFDHTFLWSVAKTISPTAPVKIIMSATLNDQGLRRPQQVTFRKSATAP